MVQTHAGSTAGLHTLEEASVSRFKATSSGDANASGCRCCQQMLRRLAFRLDFSSLIRMRALCLGLPSV